MKQAYASATPEAVLPAVPVCSCCCSLASGIGNGSTFRTIAVVFDKEQAGPALGWTSAVAAYGAFVIPQVLRRADQSRDAGIRALRLRAFYSVCLLLNWWYYLGPKAEFKNP